MRKPLVFSLVRDQSMFMTAIMSLLSFLAILAFGVALAIGTGVIKWNTQWELMATVQITNDKNENDAQKIIDANKTKMSSVIEISRDDMKKMLRPWVSGGGNVMENYLPKMYEIKFKNKADIKPFGEKIDNYARFLTHSEALQSSTSAGWRMILIAGMMLALVLLTITVCVSYIARNTAMLHRRELEILNQIGARDNFVARQMQIIVAKICAVAGLVGFVVAAPILLLIIGAAASARVGLMAMIGLSGWGWLMLALTPIAILIFAIFITKKTTLKILENN